MDKQAEVFKLSVPGLLRAVAAITSAQIDGLG